LADSRATTTVIAADADERELYLMVRKASSA
jgi:hypothetical protein